MKIFLAAFVGAIVFFASVVLVFANGGSSAAMPYACGQTGIILDTIRTLESAGNYQARSTSSTASGAYQYVDATWRNWAEKADISTELYPTADSAPPHIQDQVAGVNVTSILADHDNNVEAVPVIWYLPSAWGNDAIMDRVPGGGGNVLTVREYQTKWMGIFNEKLTGTSPVEESLNPDGTTDAAPSLCAGTEITGEWALPVPKAVIDEGTLDDPHHDYPAWDFMIPTGTPIYAVTGGIVANVGTWGGNWWSAGCTGSNPPSGCSTCGIGVTIQHPDGLRHTYCHMSAAHVTENDLVTPGQYIGDSGNSGRSGGAHLHLEFRIDNVRRCPQTLLAALYHDEPIPVMTALPTTGCFFRNT